MVATIFVERTVGRDFGAGESILTAKLVQGAVTLTHVAVVLRDSDNSFLIISAILGHLPYFHFYFAGSGIGGTTPSGVLET